MKMTSRVFTAALALAVIALSMSFAIPSDAMAAGLHHAAAGGFDLASKLTEYTPHFAAGLAVLRADLEALNKRAADKMAELTNETPEDAARAIEDEHKKLLAEIEAKKREIAAEEKRVADEERQPETRSDAARSADILDLGTRAGMDNSAIQDAIRAGTSVEAFRAAAFDHVVNGQNNTRTIPGRVIVDERETARNAAIEAMSYRMGAPVPQAGPSAAARERMDDGFISVAMACTGERSHPRNAREIESLYERAASMTTSDFPIIMEGALNRTLETRYRLAVPTYRRIARQRNFRDFRPHTSIKTGDFPMLKQVLEGGEIKYGTLSEGKEQISVLSYARALSISRQLLINDDLGAVAEMLSSYGATVALFEEVTFYATAFNGKLADGKTVFHADHKNIAEAAGAISVDTVADGRRAMSKQKTLDGNPLLANMPALIVTGPDTITSAEKLVAGITPATFSDVNIFSGRLSPFDTPTIEGSDWYLFAAPEAGSNYRWGYLEGYEAPRVRLESPFGRQGLAMSVEHDFGCGAVDYRFGYKNGG